MYYPKPLYKALPYLYILCGFYLFARFRGNGYAIFSGLIFFAAGLIVMYWRRQNEKNNSQ
jgi:dipeptide/tripeptide permease